MIIDQNPFLSPLSRGIILECGITVKLSDVEEGSIYSIMKATTPEDMKPWGQLDSVSFHKMQ